MGSEKDNKEFQSSYWTASTDLGLLEQMHPSELHSSQRSVIGRQLLGILHRERGGENFIINCCISVVLHKDISVTTCIHCIMHLSMVSPTPPPPGWMGK